LLGEKDVAVLGPELRVEQGLGPADKNQGGDPEPEEDESPRA